MRNTVLKRPMFFLYAITFFYLAICVKDFKIWTQRIKMYLNFFDIEKWIFSFFAIIKLLLKCELV